MQQTHTFTPLATGPSHDSAHAMDDVFETAMTVLRTAGVAFVVLNESEPMEQAA